MELQLTQSNRRPQVLRLAIAAGLAALLLAVLLGRLAGVTYIQAGSSILYVDGTTGQDVGTCGTTIVPCQSISYTLDNQAAGGETIRVAQGVYTENLTIVKPVTLEGGYEAGDWTRDVAQYPTVLDGSSNPTVVEDWDGDALSYPFVIEDGGSYEMWYAGRDLNGIWRIGYITSTDGVSWTRALTQPVLQVGSGEAWDSRGVLAPSVVKEGSTSYKMWYSGRGLSTDWQIGYATSTDGIDWTKHTGNPVLARHAQTWGNRFVAGPSITHEDDLHQMWLLPTADPGSYLARATSSDGVTWNTAFVNYLFSSDETHYWESDQIWGPSVLHIDGTYRMWYSAQGSWVGYTGYATSTNGMTWHKYNAGGQPVLSGTGGEWDQGAAYDPHVVFAGGTYTMWYASDTFIGVATSTDGIGWAKSADNPVLSSGTPGQYGQPVVTLGPGSDRSVLDGFTVRNGQAELGGGVLVDGADAVVRNCTIVSSTARYGGGGIGVVSATATLAANAVLANAVWQGIGAGVRVDGAVVTVSNNVIALNEGLSRIWGGDGVAVMGDGADARIVNNTILSNSSEGIMAVEGIVWARNNIINGNDGGIQDYLSGATVILDHNAFWNNSWDYRDVISGTGDIFANCLLVDPANGDYRLQPGSPCIDAGTDLGAPSVDFEGDLRPLDGDGDRIALVDIGADELNPDDAPPPPLLVPVYLPLVIHRE